MPWYLFIPALLLALAHSIYLDRINTRILHHLRSTFRDRPSMSTTEWMNTNFAHLNIPLERIQAILAPIAATLECDLTQLQAADSFATTLRWRGRSFLSIDDDNPWDEYTERSLPDLCGSPDQATAIIERISPNPTLAELVKAAG